jgi:hypothetical protein
MGDMSDMVNDGIPEPLYDYGGTLSCRYCGQSGLHWEQTIHGKWWLADSNFEFHQCPVTSWSLKEVKE